MLKPNLESRAEKFLLSLPKKHAKQVIEKIEDYCRDPSSVTIKQLVGHAPYIRIRSGEYRIIGKVEDDIFYVMIIGKRNGDEVYREFEKWKR